MSEIFLRVVVGLAALVVGYKWGDRFIPAHTNDSTFRKLLPPNAANSDTQKQQTKSTQSQPESFDIS